MSFSSNFMDHIKAVVEQLDTAAIDVMAEEMARIRDGGGRLFILGVGGSAGNASHAVNDFRKLCSFEAYAPTDNVSELTARTNDEGWDTVYSEWLKGSRANDKDCILVYSVGGGNAEKNVSVNLVEAVKLAKERNLTIFGIVGRDGGYTKQEGDNVIVVPTVDANLVTPIAESFQGIIWHCLVSHPVLKTNATKW
ncbi:MAG: sugar isomerase [Blastopirellula sp.]|nr:MAG: sugar isomerase [Blastopirellula sp.]